MFNRIRIDIIGFCVASVSCLMAVSCQSSVSEANSFPSPVSVGFVLSDSGDISTKSYLNPDGLSSSWESGDKLVLWAKNSAGEMTLDATQFVMYGLSSDLAIFTATLPQEMPQDRYTYYAVSPVPESVDGTVAKFSVPAVQDGKAGGGADILVASPSLAGPIEPVQHLSDYTKLGLGMEHILHHFRFFVPVGEDRIGGEAIEKVVISFPKDVVGTLAADYTDPDSTPSLSNGSSTVTLVLADPLRPSTSENTYYAVAAVCPESFSESDAITVKAYSAYKILEADPVSLKGRSFLRGHSTPVRLLFTNISDRPQVHFTVSGNNLGENANAIRLTAPEGCIWPNGSTVYEYRPGVEIKSGDSFDIHFEDLDIYRSFSGKTVSVTFDTEHTDATVSLTMPDMSSGSLASVSASLPYLLYEDFSVVNTFSSNDNYTSGVNVGSKSAVSFLNGWTGGRIGAEAGHCIRTAARRETSASYDSRVDSAPVIALKKPADISVSFDYGTAEKHGGIGGKEYPQIVRIGYVTDTKAYESGDDDGVFEDGNTFTITSHSNGSYTNTPEKASFTISSAPAGVVRISWLTSIEDHAGLNNNTNWLYIDNVKVQIAK